MRHSYIPFIIIAGIALLSSCARVSEIEQPTEAQKGTYTYTLSAGSQDTKTSYDAEGHFSWTAGDAISVLFHNGETNKFFTLTTNNSGALASFTGEIEDGYTIGASDGTSEDLKIWALYPASDNHSYTAGSNPSFYIQPEVDFSTTHQSANIPMYDLVAAEGGELYFKNLACAYKFVVENIKDGVDKVQFTINNASGDGFRGLSGSSDIGLDSSSGLYYVKFGGSAALTYTGSVHDNTAVFYVSYRWYGNFQPTITVTNCATGNAIKTFTASKSVQPTDMGTVQPITLDVSESNGGDYYVAAIDIDGNFDDWDDVSHVITTSDANIVEWRYTKDSKNLYFMYKIPLSKIAKTEGGYSWDPYIYFGFDTDNKATTGGSAAGVGAGMEYQCLVFPWRGTAPANPTNVIGEEANGNLKKYNGEAFVGSSHLTVGGKTIGDYNFVEVMVPIDSIGSPTGQIRVGHSFKHDSIGSTLIMPETATVSVTAADSETIGIGKTVSLGATTNSTAAITYLSSNPSVATVSEDGIVTGVTTGSATITASVAAVSGEYTAASKEIEVFVPKISIDGSFTDWSGIEELPNTRPNNESNYRYDNWKVTSDSKNIYIFMELYASGITNGSYVYVGFDTADGGSAHGGLSGLESYVVVYTCVKDSDPVEYIQGKDPRSTVNGSTDGTLQSWGVYGTGEKSGRSFVELCIPRSKVSLTSSATINVAIAYDYYNSLFYELTLE